MAVEIVRGPYLQLAQPSDITIRWSTDLPADSTVRFGLATLSEFTVSDPTPTAEHEVALTVLAAGTKYLYQVESTDGSGIATSLEYTFLTAPADRDAPVRFAALGDTGNASVASQLAARILVEEPHLVLHAGDIQYGNPADRSSWDTYFFGPAKDLLARAPVYPVLGNREYQSSGIPQLFLDAFTLPGDERFYSFDFGAVHFVTLDVYQNSDDSWLLTDLQRAWLEADLAAARTAPWTVVSLHHPIFSSAFNTSRPWEAPLQAELPPLFEEYGVDWVVMGHDHLYSRSNRNGITYVITGGGGATLSGVAADPFAVNPHHHRAARREFEYLLFEATATRMTMSARRSDGTEIDRDSKSNVRRNVVLVVGSGMGFEHVQAGRLWSGGSDAARLAMEDPALCAIQAEVNTTLSGGGIADAAAAATAMATGWRTNQQGILSEEGGVRTTILELARDGGRRTGLLSNAPLVHATPAAFGAHDDNRYHYLDHRWDLLLDDDLSRPDGDHARTFPEVLLGGGLQDPLYGLDPTFRAEAEAAGYVLAFTRSGLLALNLDAVERVMGLLDHARSDGFLQFEKERLDGLYPASDEPTLADMATRALDLLEEGERGFFLLVHSGLIDEVSRGRAPDRSAYLGPEVASLDSAVRVALDWAAARGVPGETLVLVLADHETGGLDVPDGQIVAPGATPDITWSGTAPTATRVPVFATWPAGLSGQTIDHVQVFQLLNDFLLDGDPPQPLGVAVSGITQTTATVTWTTAELSSTRVDFGLTSEYGSVVEDPARVTSHSVTLSGLSPDTSYHLAAFSRDLAGYLGRSADLSFNTLPNPPVAPTGLITLEVPAAGAVDLDWDNNPEETVVSYQVFRAASVGGPYLRLDETWTLIPLGALWRYHDLGQDLGTDWRGAAYDDSGWPRGPAELGYGDGDEATVVSYGPNSLNKYPTTYFRRTFFVADPSILTSLTLRLRRDDGAVVYLNGTEAARSNMPSGSISYATFAKSSQGGDKETEFNAFTLSPSLLEPGENLLAVEVHQVDASSSDLSFELELLGNREPLGTSSYRDHLAPTGGEVWYAISAVDSIGQESPLSAAACALPGPPPAAPAGLLAAGLSDRVDLEWSGLADCDLEGYHVGRSEASGGPYLRLSASPLLETRYTDTTARPGVTYHYVVRGVDQAAQEGPASSQASATVPDTLPPVLQDILAVEIGPVSARIVWSSDEPSDSRVDYGPSSELGSSAADPTLVTAHSVTLSGLAQGTLYHFQVFSRDSWGNLAAGESLAFETTTDSVWPVLSAVEVVDITPRSVRISWSTDEPANSLVEYGPDTGYGQEVFSGELVLSHSLSLVGLLPGTTYHFRPVSADLVGNTTPGDDGLFTTLPDTTAPGAPLGLQALPGDRQVSLVWSDSPDEDLAGYRVYRSSSSGGPYDFLAGTAVSSHLDAELLNDTAYYYVVSAFDGHGNESGYSAEAAAVPHDDVPPSVPVNFAAQATDESVRLTWTGGGEPDLAGFWLYRAPTSGAGKGVFSRLNASPLGAGSFTDDSIVRGGIYDYRVTSVDVLGNESPSSATVRSGTPGNYFSFSGSTTVPKGGGLTMKVPDEDIVRYDPLINGFTLFFDGSAAGLTSSQDLDAFDVLPDGRILISLDTDSTVPGLGLTDDSDILLWTPGSPSRHPGTWSWYFDGSDVELSSTNEDVDALSLLPDGRLLLSTTSSGKAGTLSWADEDLVVFTFTSPPGAMTTGTWALYLDGSDVGLAELSTEDLGALTPRLDGNGFYLTTSGEYSLPGLAPGTGVDILLFTPTSLGAASAGTFTLAVDGSSIGLPDSAKIDGLDYAP